MDIVPSIIEYFLCHGDLSVTCMSVALIMVWYGMVWYGMVWYGMVWYGNCLFDKIKSTLKHNGKYIISGS